MYTSGRKVPYRFVLRPMQKSLTSSQIQSSVSSRNCRKRKTQCGQTESRSSRNGTRPPTRRTSGHGKPVLQVLKVEVLLNVATGKEAQREEPVHLHQFKMHQEMAQVQKSHTIGLLEPKLDPDYLFPETESEKCPLDKNTSKHTGAENDAYVRWILRLYPRLHVRDERVYCPYCDMKNHPSWTRRYLDRHCSGCNGGPRNPNWAIYDKKQAGDQNREPNYDLPQQ